jgi:hypothetical protein
MCSYCLGTRNRLMSSIHIFLPEGPYIPPFLKCLPRTPGGYPAQAQSAELCQDLCEGQASSVLVVMVSDTQIPDPEVG